MSGGDGDFKAEAGSRVDGERVGCGGDLVGAEGFVDEGDGGGLQLVEKGVVERGVFAGPEVDIGILGSGSGGQVFIPSGWNTGGRAGSAV